MTTCLSLSLCVYLLCFGAFCSFGVFVWVFGCCISALVLLGSWVLDRGFQATLNVARLQDLRAMMLP